MAEYSTEATAAPNGPLARLVDSLEWALVQGLLQRYYRMRRNAFPSPYLHELRRAILTSPFLADNPLNYNFTGSYGFSVVFRPATREQVERAFPYFSPYLAEVLRPDCNAYYLNPLLLKESGRIAPHVDLSLRSYTQPDDPPTPEVVSLLYVEIPPGMRGGELLLYRGPRPVGRIVPRQNTVVHFRGDLRHEVSPVSIEGEGMRLSLVCEQYRLPEALLDRVPAYNIQSRVNFAAFLESELQQAED